MSLEIEQRVVGSLIHDPSLFDRIESHLNPIDFEDTTYGSLYGLIKGLNEGGCRGALADVAEAIAGQPRALQGPLKESLGLACEAPGSSSTIEKDAKAIKDASLLRQAEGLLRQWQGRIEGGIEDVGAFLEEAEKSLLHLNTSDSTSITSIKGDLKALIGRLEYRVDHPEQAFGISSPFKELNDITTGFHPGNLIILAARPSMGKTAFALNIAAHQVVKEKKPVLFFSLEMTKSELEERLLTAQASVNGMDVKRGVIGPKEWDKLLKAASSFKDGGELYIDDTSSISPSLIRSKARRINRECGGLSLIVVDYIQIMGNDRHRSDGTREQEVALLSRSLKSLAKELNVPILALSQLNRGVENRTSKKPMLSDLRESGAIEQDADVVILLYRPEYYDEDEAEGWAEINVAKHRNGPTGTIRLKWVKEYTKFETGGL